MRSQIAREKLANGTLGSRKGFAVAGDGVSGKCLITGCWYIQTGYASASFSGKGYYGVNSTQLGSITFNTKDNMKGNQTETSVQKATFNGRSSWENHWQTERYYVSGSCTGGCPMSPRSVEWQNDVSTCTGCTNSWAPIYTYGTTAYATTLHRLAWRVSGYSGYWWANIKSVKAWRNSAGTQYWYSGTYDDPALVSTPYEGGYSQFG